MDNGKRQLSEERQNQRISQEPINLNEYAGDTEDNQLACDQVNEYLTDLDRSQRLNQQRQGIPANDDQ